MAKKPYEDPTFPNSHQGAIEALKHMSTHDVEGATAKADPHVNGVYKVKHKKGESIVYLKGVKDPMGKMREHNDFEDLIHEEKTPSLNETVKAVITGKQKLIMETMRDVRKKHPLLASLLSEHGFRHFGEVGDDVHKFTRGKEQLHVHFAIPDGEPYKHEHFHPTYGTSTFEHPAKLDQHLKHIEKEWE